MHTTDFRTTVRSSANPFHPGTAYVSRAAAGRQSTTAVVVGLCVYAAVLGALGGLIIAEGMAGLGIATIVEGVLRLATAIGVRRDSRGWNTFGLAHCGVAIFAATLALPLGIIGVGINVALIRGLQALRR
jgi:hypothetical protein